MNPVHVSSNTFQIVVISIIHMGELFQWLTSDLSTFYLKSVDRNLSTSWENIIYFSYWIVLLTLCSMVQVSGTFTVTSTMSIIWFYIHFSSSSTSRHTLIHLFHPYWYYCSSIYCFTFYIFLNLFCLKEHIKIIFWNVVLLDYIQIIQWLNICSVNLKCFIHTMHP
jgi:hypothetical protein